MSIFLAHGYATGRTWCVEKDGSGDFTTIQPALDAAAPGDTVLIGPGRFIETHEVVTQGWTEDVYAEVSKDSISIIGAGAGVTLIGPEERSKQIDPQPKGIYGPSASDVNGCIIENLTVENIRDAIYWNGGVEVAHCSILGNVDAMKMWPYGCTVNIHDVIFRDNTRHGIITWGPSPEFLVTECIFERNEGGG